MRITIITQVLCEIWEEKARVGVSVTFPNFVDRKDNFGSGGEGGSGIDEGPS